MRENTFIEQNKEKWQDFEHLMKENQRNPDTLTESFVEITDDLSYARTFYPNRSVRIYLNGLAQQIFRDVYKNKRTKWNKLIEFWTIDLPTVLYQTRKDLLVAALIFLGAMLIGVFSTMHDPEFPTIILGESYIEMTRDNIAKGDPMAVYKDPDEFYMFVRITANNVFVAFRTFLFGVLCAVGTLFILIYNGIMLGAFQYFFIQEGVVIDSLFTIWIHGTLEISAIVIAGSAGLTMGKGLLFPKTLSRLESFQISARRGLKIMIGLVPVFIMAGFIESYLTRYSDAPLVIRGALIVLSLIFILGYFVWYPHRLAKTKKFKISEQKLPEATEDSSLELYQIRTMGKNLTESLMIHRRHVVPLFNGMMLLFPFVLLMFGLLFTQIKYLNFPKDIVNGVGIEKYYIPFLTGNFWDNIPFAVVHWLVWSLAFTLPFYFFSETIKQNTRIIKWSWSDLGKFLMHHLYKVVLVVALIRGILLPSAWLITVVLVLLPFLLMWLMNWILQTNNPFKAFTKAVSQFFYQPMDAWIITLGIVFIMSIYTMLVQSAISLMLIDIINMQFITGEDLVNKILQVLYMSFSIVGWFMILPLFVYALGMHYFSVLERSENILLRQRVAKMDVEE